MNGILILTPEHPGGLNGANLYLRQAIKALSSRYWVHLLALRNLPEGVIGQNVAGCQSLRVIPNVLNVGLVPRIRGATGIRPRAAAEINVEVVMAAVSELIQTCSPDALLLDHRRAAVLGQDRSFMARIAELGLAIGYICHNAEASSIWTSARLARNPYFGVAGALEAARIWHSERVICHAVDAVSFISEEDKRKVVGGGAGIFHVVPPWIAPPRFGKSERTGSNSILLAGSFAWLPKRANAEWVIREILPRLHGPGPQPVLVVAGHRASEIAVPDRLKPRVRLVESPTDEDLKTLYQSAGCCLVPERQEGGIKLKALEAAALGVPIVSTREGVAGTGMRHGIECIVADNVDQFVEGIRRVLANGNDFAATAQTSVAQAFNEEKVNGLWHAFATNLFKSK